MYIMPVTLRKECFMHLHAYITGGHLGRRKTHEKSLKSVSIGVTCTVMFRIGAESAQLVVQENSHQDMRKPPLDRTMWVIQWKG